MHACAALGPTTLVGSMHLQRVLHRVCFLTSMLLLLLLLDRRRA
jgi:hypothetical protein